MATVLIQAFITLDGFLVQERTLSVFLENPDKYDILQTGKKGICKLPCNMSFLALNDWKASRNGILLMDAVPDTLDAVDSLLRFRMADELVLYILPSFQGDGIRLFMTNPGQSSWELTGIRKYGSGICRMHYRRIAYGYMPTQ